MSQNKESRLKVFKRKQFGYVLFAIISFLSLNLFWLQYVSNHRISSGQRMQIDLQKLDAAIEQYELDTKKPLGTHATP
jgi:hypothetical protein